MLEVRNIRVRSLDLRSMQIAWEIAPTPDDVLDYRFQVLRSEGPQGPWDALCDWFVDKYLFVDNTVEPFHMHRRMHYVIRVREVGSGKEKDFGPAAEQEEPDLIALEVRRHWEVRLREFTGRRSWLFPIRTFGSTCRNCYSNTDQRVTNSQCLSCFSTGFVRGYHQPIEIWAQYMPTPKDIKLSPEIRQESVTTIYVTALPDVKPKDLIVDPDNRRWKVNFVRRTTRLSTVLHQELMVTECAPGDIEYRVPVNFDNLISSPIAEERNFQYRTTIG